MLALLELAFPSSSGATHLVICALIVAEEMYIQTPHRVEEKNTSSVLAKALTILEDTDEKQASMMMMLSFTLKWWKIGTKMKVPRSHTRSYHNYSTSICKHLFYLMMLYYLDHVVVGVSVHLPLEHPLSVHELAVPESEVTVSL